MKKIFALILVLVLALVVFSSCAKKEEAKQETLKFPVYNRSGETITKLTIATGKGTSAISVGNIDDGAECEISQITVDSDDTLKITVALKMVEVTFPLEKTAKAITVVPGPNLEYVAPEK